jgi:hydrogenase 3 maturation protease
MGLGNQDYGDDAAGIRLAEELIAAGVPDVMIAGNRPEACLGRAAGEGFAHLVFLDAVEFGGAPGAVVWLDSAAMISRYPQISTHKISLGLLARWAEANGVTRAWLLGMQPESLRAGAPLSAPLEITVAALKELWQELKPSMADGKAC